MAASNINNRNFNFAPISLNREFNREQIVQNINNRVSCIDKEIKVKENLVKNNNKLIDSTNNLISGYEKSIGMRKQLIENNNKLIEGGEKLIKLHQEQKENISKQIESLKMIKENNCKKINIVNDTKSKMTAVYDRANAKFQALLDRKSKRSNNTELTTTTPKLEESKNSIIPSTQKVLDTSTSGKPNPTSNEINDRLAAIRAKRLNKIVEPNTTVSVNNRNNTKEVSLVLPENKASVSVGTQTDNTVAVVTPKKTVTAIDQGTQTENKLSKQDVAKLSFQAFYFVLESKYKEAQEKYDTILNQNESSKKEITKDYIPLDEQLRRASKMYLEIQGIQRLNYLKNMPKELEASILAVNINQYISLSKMEALNMIENMFYYSAETKEDQTALPKGSLIKEQTAEMEDRIKKHEIAIDYQNQQIAKMSNSDQAKNTTTTSIPSKTAGLANSYRPSSNLVHDLRTDNKQEKENSVVSTLPSQQYKYIVQSQTNIWESIVAANVRKSV